MGSHVHDLTNRGVGLKVLTGQGAAIDTTTAAGNLVFGIFAALSEYEKLLISERTTAGPASACARGPKGGRPYKMTPAKVRPAAASMGLPDTNVAQLRKRSRCHSADPVSARLTHRAGPRWRQEGPRRAAKADR